MKIKDIEIKNSKIHGKGVFANRNFKKGEIVVKYNLKLLTKKEFKELPEKEKHYTDFHDGKYWLFQEPERYVNHSCDANTKQVLNKELKCDIATRSIKKGEEITADYSRENIPGLNMECNCGSKNCTGIIN